MRIIRIEQKDGGESVTMFKQICRTHIIESASKEQTTYFFFKKSMFPYNGPYTRPYKMPKFEL